MHYLLKLTRPLTSFMAALSVLIGAFAIVGKDLIAYIPEMILAFFTVFFICTAGFVFNDYLDRDGDKVNHPERPIPSRKIKPKKALLLSLGIFLCGLVCVNFLGWLYSPFSFIIVIIGIVALIAYEIVFKKVCLAGNATIGILVALTYLFGSFVVLSPDKLIQFNAAHILALLAFFAIIGREIIMDIEDAEGDIKRHTLPRLFGKKKSAIIASTFLCCAMLIGPLPFYPFGMLSIYYLPFLLIGDGILLYSIYIQLQSPALARKTTKIALLVSSVGFIVGSIK